MVTRVEGVSSAAEDVDLSCNGSDLCLGVRGSTVSGGTNCPVGRLFAVLFRTYRRIMAQSQTSLRIY